MGIGYHTAERPQTFDEYNNDLEAGNAEIEKGNFMTNDQLKKEIKSW
jgi:predicted transcriptional regulator